MITPTDFASQVKAHEMVLQALIKNEASDYVINEEIYKLMHTCTTYLNERATFLSRGGQYD